MARQVLLPVLSRGTKLLPQSVFNRAFRNLEFSTTSSLFGSSSDHNIPVPNNVEELDAGQKAQFSRKRSRDINGPVLQSARGSFGPGFMSGASERSQAATDAHIGSYDCNGAVSLHSVMQTNVPEPFSPKGKAPSHLNMPGGQWSQEDKYLSQDMQDAHAATNTPLPVRDSKSDKVDIALTCNSLRYYSTSASPPNPEPSTPLQLSRKEKLKRAVKEYGATVIVFHVAISLLSLGGCYVAVSSGLDVIYLLDKIGLGSHAAAAGASTFVVSYAVHKVFAPVRISITLASAPFIVRYLRKVGILKPPKLKNS